MEPRTLFADALVPACVSFLDRKPLFSLSRTRTKTADTHNQIQHKKNLYTNLLANALNPRLAGSAVLKQNRSQ